ncbi:hypothetical protein COU14_01835 [Candidatus Kaiserbacteria bacterium CG10_big_fil_rev_8_21_14_0_10_44_10]|uniref:Uncharacterized protein n=1 Tax=Candidatus Kaiserbacteria bacterium CG10_big_fil_rev_8_21_14_0_10_44_10 TaxID=1974606 RepID=A0A2H0UHK7_9BACT|nr:MAG: hypothetical protein COU14_01835 [Candidatus Kaiserbacteria bacterium CG10_big_fil_rev_8_21_14_0_10_44_10]
MGVSKYESLKPSAIKLRKQGLSIPEIEKRTGIPRSNLSGWLKTVPLTNKQKQKLHDNWTKALVTARKGAVKWHNEQKRLRLKKAHEEALETLDKINQDDRATLELALAILYLGEGTKRKVETSLPNSDPSILRFFIAATSKLYGLERTQFYAVLYLRYDQDVEETIKYWSRALGLPISAFKRVNRDKRTAGTKTYATYKGVCNVHCGSVAIQRKLVYLANAYLDKIN